MDIFSYFDLAEGQFRLLRVASTEGGLKCEIRDFALHPPPDYFALSYTWGTEEATKTVLCNDKPFPVKPNLYSALEQLSMKPELKEAWLWIDAICINQGNIEEKNVQVMEMPDVYTSARKVLIWLGVAADNSDLAMDNISGLTEIVGSVQKDLLAQEAAQRHLPPRNHPIWSALVKLYQRPWFRRLWIMQEAILAKGIFVLCGNRTLNWSPIEDFSDGIMRAHPAVLFQNGQDPNDTRVSGFVSASQIKVWRNLLPNNDLTFFSSLLSTTREREVLNPLDRIYGLLALMPKQVRDVINVNYEWEFWEGYLDFCKWFIQQEPTLSILSMAPSVERPDKLPSWCPNFHSASTEGVQYSFHMGFNAGFHDRNSRRSTIKPSDEGHTIIVPGFRLDTVRTVVQTRLKFSPSPSPADNRGPDGIAAKNLIWETECLRLFSEAYPAQQLSLESLEIHARTLAANHFQATEPIPSDMLISSAYLSLKDFWTWLSSELDVTKTQTIATTAAKQSQLKYLSAISVQKSRTYFNTKSGRVGLGPNNVEPGDSICVFYSGGPLFALRFGADGKTAKLVGDAFMYGLMDLNTMPADLRGDDEDFLVI